AILKVALLVVISSLLRGCHCVTLARLSWPRSRPKPGKLKYISDNTSTQHRWLSGGSPSRETEITYETVVRGSSWRKTVIGMAPDDRLFEKPVSKFRVESRAHEVVTCF